MEHCHISGIWMVYFLEKKKQTNLLSQLEILSWPVPLWQQHSLSCSIRSHSCATDEYGKEKRRHNRLSSFLVPAWLQKTMSPVRPYSSWEPQGNSERLYSPLFELLQSFMLCFLSKTVSGKWVVLFWFPPACCFWGRRPHFRGVQSVNSKTASASNGVEGLRTREPLEHAECSLWAFSATFSPHTAQNIRSAFQTQASEVQGLQVM